MHTPLLSISVTAKPEWHINEWESPPIPSFPQIGGNQNMLYFPPLLTEICLQIQPEHYHHGILSSIMALCKNRVRIGMMSIRGTNLVFCIFLLLLWLEPLDMLDKLSSIYKVSCSISFVKLYHSIQLYKYISNYLK